MTGQRPDRQLTLATKRRAERTALHRLAEVRGWTGGFRAPHRTVGLTTDDGVELAASWLPGPSKEAPAVVVLHGFAAHRRKPAYAALADHLAARANVLAVDLRGHGQSQGACQLGAEEWRDVHAAVDTLRGRGHDRVVVVGLSMGGTATAHALARGLEVDGAALISSSARHWDLSRPGITMLHDLVHAPVKRRVWQAVAGFKMVPPDQIAHYPDPVELVAQTSVPLLIVHAPDDDYFAVSHAEALHAAAGGSATLWIEPPGFGHAEQGITPAFTHRLADAIATLTRTGAFPPHPPVSAGDQGV